MFSVNQVKHLYVVSKLSTALSFATDTVGALLHKVSPDGWFQWFQYKGNGGLMATDRIKKRKVKYITVTDAAALALPLKKWEIALNSSVNSGAPVVGQDYIINISFKNYFVGSDEHTYEKHASARAFSTTASDLYRDLAISLVKNMSREVDQPFTVQLKTSGSPVDVAVTAKKETLTGTYTGIILTELEQPWNLGRMKLTRPDFTIHFVPVTVSGVDRYDWGAVTESDTANVIGNGKETADLEWFCMGERGDQYRGKDWPLSITTPANLMVDPSKQYNYLNVHFWDDIDNEGPQKSERDLVLVADADGSVDLEDLEGLAKTIAQAAGLDFYIKTYIDDSGNDPVKKSEKVDVQSAAFEDLAEAVDAIGD